MDDDDFGDLYDNVGNSNDQNDDYDVTKTNESIPSESFDLYGSNNNEEEEDELLYGSNKEADFNELKPETSTWKDSDSPILEEFDANQGASANENEEDDLYSQLYGDTSGLDQTTTSIGKEDRKQSNNDSNPNEVPSSYISKAMAIQTGTDNSISFTSHLAKPKETFFEEVKMKSSESDKRTFQGRKEEAESESDEDDFQIVLAHNQSTLPNLESSQAQTNIQSDSMYTPLKMHEHAIAENRDEDEDEEDYLIIVTKENTADSVWKTRNEEENMVETSKNEASMNNTTSNVEEVSRKQNIINQESNQSMCNQGGYSSQLPVASPYMKYIRPSAAASSNPNVPPGTPQQFSSPGNLAAGGLPLAGKAPGGDSFSAGKSSPALNSNLSANKISPSQRSGFMAAGFMGGMGRTSFVEFILPPNKTIYDIDIESIEDKPWRRPNVDISDYFNFDLNESNWKEYCKQMAQLKLESTMQGKIKVYESGRIDQEYDPDLPPELAKAVNLFDNISHLNDAFLRQNADSDMKFNQSGRAIQVESFFGNERKPSYELRKPRPRDPDVVIEIFIAENEEIRSDYPMDGQDYPPFPYNFEPKPIIENHKPDENINPSTSASMSAVDKPNDTTHAQSMSDSIQEKDKSGDFNMNFPPPPLSSFPPFSPFPPFPQQGMWNVPPRGGFFNEGENFFFGQPGLPGGNFAFPRVPGPDGQNFFPGNAPRMPGGSMPRGFPGNFQPGFGGNFPGNFPPGPRGPSSPPSSPKALTSHPSPSNQDVRGDKEGNAFSQKPSHQFKPMSNKNQLNPPFGRSIDQEERTRFKGGRGERERDREKDGYRERERDRDRDRDGERERDRERERERDGYGERERDRNRDRERERERERDGYGERERDRNRYRDREKEREGMKERERRKEEERERKGLMERVMEKEGIVDRRTEYEKERRKEKDLGTDIEKKKEGREKERMEKEKVRGEREKEKIREVERERDRENERMEKDKVKEVEREKEKEKSRFEMDAKKMYYEKEKERGRERDGIRDSSKERSREVNMDMDVEKDKEREREKDRGKVREGFKSMDETKALALEGERVHVKERIMGREGRELEKETKERMGIEKEGMDKLRLKQERMEREKGRERIKEEERMVRVDRKSRMEKERGMKEGKEGTSDKGKVMEDMAVRGREKGRGEREKGERKREREEESRRSVRGESMGEDEREKSKRRQEREIEKIVEKERMRDREKEKEKEKKEKEKEKEKERERDGGKGSMDDLRSMAKRMEKWNEKSVDISEKDKNMETMERIVKGEKVEKMEEMEKNEDEKVIERPIRRRRWA